VTETTAPLYSCPTVSSSTFIVWAGPGLGLRGPLPPARLGLASATGSSSTSDSAAARVTTCWRSTCLGCLRNRRAGRGERKFDEASHSHVEPTSQPAPHDTSAWNRMHGAANTLRSKKMNIRGRERREMGSGTAATGCCSVASMRCVNADRRRRLRAFSREITRTFYSERQSWRTWWLQGQSLSSTAARRRGRRVRIPGRMWASEGGAWAQCMTYLNQSGSNHD